MPFPVYCDENAQDGIFLGLARRDGADCLTSNEAGNSGMIDEQQLEYAVAQGRALLTYDKEDFQRLHSLWSHAGKEHCGIIIATSDEVVPTRLHSALMRLQAVRTPEDMRNAILFVGPDPIEDVS